MDMAKDSEIIVTRNGQPAAHPLGMNDTVSFLSDRLVGLIISSKQRKCNKK